jgi:hypothetical protein
MPRSLPKIQKVADAIQQLIPAANIDERLLALSVELADRLLGVNWLDEPQRRQIAVGDWAIELYPTLKEVERASGSRLNLESASDWLASALRSTFEDLKSSDFRGSKPE